jgi:hypothetical protein
VSANRLESLPGVATLSVRLTRPSDVEMEVLDSRGKRMWAMQLLHERVGEHTICFEGCDRKGRPLRKGTYFYRVTAGGSTVTRKVIIAKDSFLDRLLQLARPMLRV